MKVVGVGLTEKKEKCEKRTGGTEGEECSK